MQVRWTAYGLVDKVQAVALAGLLLALLSIPGIVVVETWLGHEQMRRAWTVEGPPCPTVARPSFNVVGPKPPKTFTYGAIEWSRQFGHVSCVAIREAGFGNVGNYRVCRFNAPAMVAVKLSDGRKVIYEPGVARPVTVTVRHGQATCVMNA